MKFNVNANILSEALFSCIEVTTKNFNKEFDGAGKITLEAKKEGINAVSHGGAMSVIASISNDNFVDLEYECETEGEVTIDAAELDEAIKSMLSFNVCVDATGSKMIISYMKETGKGTHEERQIVAFKNEKVNSPVLAKKFDKSVSINREVFVDGISKVQFAVGWAQTQPYYMVEMVEVENDKVRFASGTGARFAVLDVEGKKIIKGVDEKIQYFFPKDSVANVIKVLSHASSLDIDIKYAESSKGKNRHPAQMVIDFQDGMKLILLGLDSSVKYPELNNILQFDYPYQISSELSNWKAAVMGAGATYTSEIKAENDIHNTDVTASLENNYFLIETKLRNETERTVDFGDEVVYKDKDVADPSFRCGTNYLQEVYHQGGKSGPMTLLFEAAPEADGGKLRPITVKFADKHNEVKETVEKFSMFFATSKR
jgi:DNA polymerase III sliding clamp (beta) subunit (PCNA family)